MSAGSGSASLDGNLIMLPFISEEYVSTIKGEYEELATEYGADRVLILNRYPSGTNELEDKLAEAVQKVERPRIEILSHHATRVLELTESPPEIFGRRERSVLIREFLAEHEWDTEYLRKAATTNGFRIDFHRFIVTASYQRRPESIEDPVLADLYDSVFAFHEFCEERLPAQYDLDRGFLDRTRAISTAVELLDEPAVGGEVRENFDAVLALEFEEFERVPREYLAQLTEGKELVAIGQANSAVQRPFSETGSIEDAVSTMQVEANTSEPPANPLQMLSAYLGTGKRYEADLSRVVERIHAQTFREHVEAIGEEIRWLHETHRVSYNDIAVVVRDASAPLEETNEILRTQGLPTTSTTVRGLEHDPASRELLAVARWLAATESEADIDAADAYDTLISRVSRSFADEDAAAIVDAGLDAAGRAPDVHAGLWRWIVRSGLKALLNRHTA